MQSPSKIKPDKIPLFLDASVIINLVASGCSAEILKALDRPIYLERTVCREFKRNPFDGGSTDNLINGLVAHGCFSIVHMTEPQLDVFLNLTGANPPDDLGDGEAATLACALNQGAAILDERKAIRIASRDFPNVIVYSSLDLFCAEQVIRFLGEEKAKQSLCDAIKLARMRIPHLWEDWLFTVLGKTREAVINGRDES